MVSLPELFETLITAARLSASLGATVDAGLFLHGHIALSSVYFSLPFLVLAVGGRVVWLLGCILRHG